MLRSVFASFPSGLRLELGTNILGIFLEYSSKPNTVLNVLRQASSVISILDNEKMSVLLRCNMNILTQNNVPGLLKHFLGTGQVKQELSCQ